MGLNKTPMMDEDDMITQLKAWEELCLCYDEYIQITESGNCPYLEKRRLQSKIDAARTQVDKY